SARDTHCVVTADSATSVTRIEHVPIISLSHDERPFDEIAFPRLVITHDLFHFSDEFQPIRRKLLNVDWSRLALGVSVFFPEEILLSVGIVDRHSVERTNLLTNHCAMIVVRSFDFFRCRHTDAESMIVSISRGVIDVEGITYLRDLWCPVI